MPTIHSACQRGLIRALARFFVKYGPWSHFWNLPSDPDFSRELPTTALPELVGAVRPDETALDQLGSD